MFFLFAWSEYDAYGGLGDLRGTYASEEAAKQAFESRLSEGSFWDSAEVVTVRAGNLVIVAEWDTYAEKPGWILPV